MHEREALFNLLKDAEKIAKVLQIRPFSLYLLGGSACILGEYLDRATRDFDILDLNYPSQVGKVLRFLGDFDLLEYESTPIAPSFKERAIKLEGFEYIRVYVLSKEDIVVSKIIRLDEKDIEDIDKLMPSCNKELINKIIEEILSRKDFFETKKKRFLEKLEIFRVKYDV
ncbi:hypothetical protein ELD05_12340 [Caldicellulosiruptor changbaiensis]|uniref:DUF6036 domain-containing protein n=1 Tax=Caldicellulosiruptor changbaiensis TaxID=1222016 RepID=A0A3T0D8F5_9FIRM|nr:DUF6036 family nucleotidyltransferase [Caldicellulosiruptor changbaiensis]AZT91333.1 hypothetical protein ELD05_12340 [Caldicellulosiruptor changbaiensis]